LEKTIQGLAEKSPIRRLALPEDIAYAALFLASDESAYINGVAIPIDGGKIARY
jgi:3-oxoacyl-[acyl-carrier protein] reductase